MAGTAARDSRGHRPAVVDFGSRRFHVRRRRGAAVRAAAFRGATDRQSGPNPLVQPLRSPARMACHDPSSRGGGLLLLPAFLYGTLAGRWHAEAFRRRFCELRTGTGNLPMVPLCRSSPRRRRALAQGSRGSLSAHRSELGRQLSSRRGPLVRPADEGPGFVSHHRHLLLHPGTYWSSAEPYQPTKGRRRFRGILRKRRRPLRVIHVAIYLDAEQRAFQAVRSISRNPEPDRNDIAGESKLQGVVI